MIQLYELPIMNLALKRYQEEFPFLTFWTSETKMSLCPHFTICKVNRLIDNADTRYLSALARPFRLLKLYIRSGYGSGQIADLSLK